MSQASPTPDAASSPLGRRRLTARPALSRHGPAAAGIGLVAAAVAAANLKTVWSQWSTAVADPLDARFQAWTLHWVQGAMVGRHGLIKANTFLPATDSLTFSDHLVGIAAPLLPLQLLGLSPAAMLNTALVVGAALNAVAGYLFGYSLTRRRAAAVVAGAVWSIGPIPHALSLHLHTVWRPGLPLALVLLTIVADRAAGTRKWPSAPGDGVLLGALAAVVAWQGLVSYYEAIFLGLVVGLFVLVRARDLRRRLVPVLAALGLGAAVVAASTIPYLAARAERADYRWRLEDTYVLRAAPAHIEDGSLVWGSALGAPVFSTTGFNAFPGLALVLLSVVGAGIGLRRRRRHAEGDGTDAAPAAATRTAARLGLTVLVVGAVLAAGAGAGWGRWTPYALAFRFVPGFSVVRSPGRFILVALLGAVALTAVAVDQGLSWWADRRGGRGGRGVEPPWRALVAVVLVALLVAEGLTLGRGRDVTAAAPRPLDRLLADQPDGAVVYLPVGFDGFGALYEQSAVVIRSTAHDRPMINGFAGYVPDTSRRLARRLQTLPAPDALDCLTAFDVRYVVVTEGATGTWSALREPSRAQPLELVARRDGELLYRLPDRPDAGSCDLTPGR